ncbi:MAG: ribosomal protein S18-alanine N-acetyltransferase [Gammaproteobacteria bacterium]|nr:ribosomal protein S18-alanine N-acetyltransferase [Gammaproteobacteria bacterium]
MSSTVSSDLQGLSIHPMSDADISAVFDIEQRAYEHGWTEGILKDCIRVGYLCWTVQIDEQIIGYGIISVGAGEAHLLNLAIDPQFQKRGLGRRVLHFLLDIAQKRGAETIFLEVRDSNRSAIALYLDEGFNQIGVRNGYYPSDKGREDAIIMALSFSSQEES